MRPEESARRNIDNQLRSAGWIIQDIATLNLGAGLGVAVREFPLKTGFADYMLFLDRNAVGVVEAKPEGTTLSGVSDQTEKYLAGLPDNLPHVGDVLPFAYESTGVETFFRDSRDPEPRSRRVFSFHQPRQLGDWLSQGDTLRARLRRIPPLATRGLRECQIEAITNLEESLAQDQPRALIQMATGSGKTYTAVSFTYRLLKFAKAKRVLFLVDRRTLGRQTLQEFQQYVTPDDGRKFTELYKQAVVVSEIERRLAIADMLKETITGSMAKSSMMRQSLLRRAFTGQLVPQDPTDEPASKLLERIRAERARIEAEQPRRRKRRAN